MTFDLGLALCGLFLGLGIAVAGWRIASSLAARTFTLRLRGLEPVGEIAAALRFSAKAAKGMVRPAAEPRPTPDARMAPFEAWKSMRAANIGSTEMSHLEWSYAVVAGIEPGDAEQKRSAVEFLRAYNVPMPPRDA